MMGRKPGMFPSFSDAYAEGEGYPHPVPFDLFDPFGLQSKMTPEKKEKSLLAEVNNGRLAMIGLMGLLAESRVPGSVPFGPKVEAYAGEIMAPFL